VPANDRSSNDHLVADAPRRRRRLLAHLFMFSVAGLLATVVGGSSASAVQEGRFLPAGTATATYTCNGADPDTQALLDAVGLSTFEVPVSITSAAVEPSPSPGEDFSMEFTWTFTLPQPLANIAVGLGITDLTIHDSVDPMNAVSGATGSVVGLGGSQVVNLGDGTHSVSYTEGPFVGTVNRTAAVDEPIVFGPGPNTNTVETGLATLHIACAPGAVQNMSLVDEDGTAPSTTTTTRPATSTTAGTSTTAATGGTELPATGGVDLRLVVLALALIDIGYLAWSAGQPPRRRKAA
jgi:hypothetical protein